MSLPLTYEDVTKEEARAGEEFAYKYFGKNVPQEYFDAVSTLKAINLAYERLLKQYESRTA